MFPSGDLTGDAAKKYLKYLLEHSYATTAHRADSGVHRHFPKRMDEAWTDSQAAKN
jgi:hypothetical protein